jgi:hypothetical protein
MVLFGKVREREGAGSFVAVPHGHFRTVDDKWVAIACTTDKMFERFAAVMGKPELAAADCMAISASAWRHATGQPIVIEWVGSLDRDEVLQRCLDEEVPIGKVNSIADIFEDEHFQARGNLAVCRKKAWVRWCIPGVCRRCPKRRAGFRISGHRWAMRPMKSCASCSGSRRRKSSGCGNTRSSERTIASASMHHQLRGRDPPLPLAGIRVIDVPRRSSQRPFAPPCWASLAPTC